MWLRKVVKSNKQTVLRTFKKRLLYQNYFHDKCFENGIKWRKKKQKLSNLRKIYSKKYSSTNAFDLVNVLKRADEYLEPCQISNIECSSKIVNNNYFRKMLDLKCLTWFWIRLWRGPSSVQQTTKYIKIL